MTQKKKAESSAKDMRRGKVCIVTLYDNINFGNKLQNYAVKCLIEQRGFEAHTLVIRKDPFREPVKLAIRSIKASRGDKRAERYVNLSAFSTEYLGIDYYYALNGQIDEDINRRYDFFVTGSDQVWNPEVRTTDIENFLLTFTSDKKKVSLAPSLGTTIVPDEMKTRFSDGLLGFKKLSCREQSGCRVIGELTGREVIRLCDPTLALTAKFWREFAAQSSDSVQDAKLKAVMEKREVVRRKEKESGRPYILMFFLGECDERLKKLIYEYAEEKGCDVRCPSSVSDADYAMLPQEFVAGIDGARMVFTDSYHAAAFSVNLETPFWVFDRKRDNADDLNTHMGSRIESLTENFGLKKRYIRDIERLESEGISVFDVQVSFEEAREQFEFERERMKEYLDDALVIPKGLAAMRELIDE